MRPPTPVLADFLVQLQTVNSYERTPANLRRIYRAAAASCSSWCAEAGRERTSFTTNTHAAAAAADMPYNCRDTC